MAYIYEKTPEQICLIMIYEEASNILKCIKQYKFITYNNCESFDTIYKDYPDLFCATLEAFRYQIIVGTTKLVVKNQESICVDKLLNIIEQLNREELKDIKQKILHEKEQFSQLIDNLRLIRDKVFAHTDLKYTKKEDSYLIFDLVDSKIYTEVESILIWVIEKCIEISKVYDDDKFLLSLKYTGLKKFLMT